MKCYVVDSFIGFFAYNEDLKLVSAKTFENPEEAISQLYDLEKLGTCSILKDFVSDLLKMGYDSFIFEEELEAKSFKGKFSAESTVIAPSEGGRVFRSSTAEACEAAGVSPKQMEKMLKAVSESLLKNRVRTASEKRDRLVAQAVAAQDEIDKSVNIGVSRIREWYGLHFPELDTLVPDHKQYLKIITKFGTRSNLDEFTRVWCFLAWVKSRHNFLLTGKILTTLPFRYRIKQSVEFFFYPARAMTWQRKN